MNRKNEMEIGEATEKLLENLKAVVRDGEELLRAGAHELGEQGEAARERLTEALESARKMGRRLQHHALNGARATDKVIREHPYESLGTAFGIGLLLGVLINRR